jgi:hypothetical protein
MANKSKERRLQGIIDELETLLLDKTLSHEDWIDLNEASLALQGIEDNWEGK